MRRERRASGLQLPPWRTAPTAWRTATGVVTAFPAGDHGAVLHVPVSSAIIPPGGTRQARQDNAVAAAGGVSARFLHLAPSVLLNRRWLVLAAGACLATLASRALLRRSRRFEFAGTTVLIAGGSRGMGLVLARQLIDAGARVAILARTSADLQAARQELQARGGDVLATQCDVGQPEEVQSAVQHVLERFGGVDVLFNFAGVIQVGPLESMTREDFRRAMDVHFWGALNTTLEVLPDMRRRGWGRIVNIASLGGKRAVPHMLPYTASKFALVGLSNGLRTELTKDGILVTTVIPSLVRTGSTRNALFKGQHRKEHAWFSIAGALPGVAMSAERAAAQIVRACRDGEREVLLRHPANLAVALQSFFPGLTQSLLGVIARVLPRMGGIGTRSACGYESASRWSPSLLTRSGDAAARRNNEMARHA